MKIGLALGGGVARGFFHIGALKAIEKLKIKVDVISGTSMGAVIGGLYALKADANYIEETILKVLGQYQKEISFLKNSFSQTNVEAKTAFLEKCFSLVKEFYIWNLRIAKPSMVELKPFLKIFKNLFENFSFSDCKIPFMVTSVDLIKGELICINDGLLYKGILASSVYPGFFPPLKWENKLLVDGGVLMPIPAQILRDKVNFVIAINLESSGYRFPAVRSAMDVLNLADRIRYKKIIEGNLTGIDFLISPDLESFSWGDFGKAKELVEKGEKETLERGEELIKILRKEKIKRFFFIKRFR